LLGLVTGWLGSGKTIWLTYIASKFPDVQIFSNFTIKLSNVKPVDILSVDQITDGLLLLDEAYAWLESRLSMSDVNLYLSRLVFNSRKRGLDIWCSAQLESSMEMRYRHLTDINVSALGEARDGRGYYYMVGKRLVMLPKLKALELFPLFDTYEQQPIARPTIFDAKTIEPKVKELTNKIFKKYGQKAQITQGIIEDIFLANNWDMNYRDWVYYRIKRLQMEEGGQRIKAKP